MSNLIVIDHPLVQHKLSMLRDKETGAKAFRELVTELAMLMAYEVTRNLELKEVENSNPPFAGRLRVFLQMRNSRSCRFCARASAWRTA